MDKFIGWLQGQFRALRRAYCSWTINWGVLLVVFGQFHEHINEFMPLVKEFIPNDKTGAFVSAVGVIVLLLRVKTTKPLSEK